MLTSTLQVWHSLKLHWQMALEEVHGPLLWQTPTPLSARHGNMPDERWVLKVVEVQLCLQTAIMTNACAGMLNLDQCSHGEEGTSQSW